MNRYIFLITLGVIVSFMGCSDKQAKVKEAKNNLQKVMDINKAKKTKTIKKTSKKVTVLAPSIGHNNADGSSAMPVMIVEEAFVPEHIKRSHIEVVPH